jgi:galactoside 2-L-fucosyltransferase 1/2
LRGNDILGSGESKSPYQDLALLAACNHSIITYGTFGLTGALLAQGGYTIIFDTGRANINPETRIASSLPRWYIMDQNGTLKYENEILV